MVPQSLRLVILGDLVMVVADSEEERGNAIYDILDRYRSGGTRQTALAKLIMLDVYANEATGLLDEIEKEIDELWSRAAAC